MTEHDHLRERARGWVLSGGICSNDVGLCLEELFNELISPYNEDCGLSGDPSPDDKANRIAALAVLRSAANLFPGDIAGDLLDHGETALSCKTIKLKGEWVAVPVTVREVMAGCRLIFRTALPDAGPLPPRLISFEFAVNQCFGVASCT